MDCEHKNLSRDEFNQKVKFYSSMKELLFFLMNTLNLIFHNEYYYCYCEKYDK